MINEKAITCEGCDEYIDKCSCNKKCVHSKTMGEWNVEMCFNPNLLGDDDKIICPYDSRLQKEHCSHFKK